jgi:hypothetical protein
MGNAREFDLIYPRPTTGGTVSDRSKGISRRQLLTGTGKAAAVAAAASALGWVEVGNPAEASPPGEIGNAGGGRNAFEFRGNVDQDGDDLKSYGFLSLIYGLDVSQLFTGDPHDETTARFTFFGRATLVSRVEGSGLFIIDATGGIDYYFNLNGGASFDDPSTFRAGKQIASDTAAFHDVMGVIAQDTGLPHLTAALERTKAVKFVLDGIEYRLGHVGMLQRSTASGLSTRTDPKPKSKLTLGGEAIVTG